MPAQLFADPDAVRALDGHVSAPSSPGAGMVRNAQRTSPVRAS